MMKENLKLMLEAIRDQVYDTEAVLEKTSEETVLECYIDVIRKYADRAQLIIRSGCDEDDKREQKTAECQE